MIKQTAPARERRPLGALLTLCAVPMLAAGCAKSLISEAPLTISDGSRLVGARAATPLTSQNISAAVAALLPEDHEMATFALCEADRTTGECRSEGDSLNAAGLGGLFLPLVLELDGFDLRARETATDRTTVTTRFDVTVNKIPPTCVAARGTFTSRDDTSLTLSYGPFYCNWVVIGNVLTDVTFSIDQIDMQTRTFTGNYALQMNGTGNAAGTGYFRAFPKPPPPQPKT